MPCSSPSRAARSVPRKRPKWTTRRWARSTRSDTAAERLRKNAEAEGRGIVLRLEGLVRARVRARLGHCFSDSETLPARLERLEVPQGNASGAFLTVSSASKVQRRGFVASGSCCEGSIAIALTHIAGLSFSRLARKEAIWAS